MPTSMDILDELPTDIKELLRQRFTAVDAMDLDAFVTLHSDDHQMVFGHRPAVVGLADMSTQVAEFWKSIQGLTHNLRRIAQTADRVYVESVVDYDRLDGRQVQVPVCDVFTIAGGRIAETRAYVDQSPVWEP